MKFYDIQLNAMNFLKTLSGKGVNLISETGEPLNNTPYNELIVAEKTTLIELKSIYGLSNLRDDIIQVGTGTVINDLREYVVNVNGINSEASLKSVERGRYIAGKSSEYGIGIRTSSSTITGDMVVKWGALNVANGMYFGKDLNGIFVAVLDDNNETKIYQEDWNNDKLDGTGDSGLTLDTTKGNIYNIVYTWYGYGVITFKVLLKTITGMRTVNCHTYIVDGKTSVKNPNLSVGTSITQTTSTNDFTVYVGGRQFSILGSYTPSFRSISDYILKKTVPSLTTNPTPIMSFKKKTTFKAATAKLSEIDIVTDIQVIIEVYIAPVNSLTSANFITPTRINASETAFEVDKSATAFDITNANMVYRAILKGGDRNTTNQGQFDNLILDIPEDKILVISGFSTATDAVVDGIIQLREEW